MATRQLKFFRRAALSGPRVPVRDARRGVRDPKRVALLILLAVAPVFGAELSLVDAVKAGNRDVVRAILATPAGKAAVSAPEADGTTALHWATRADDGMTAKLLVAAGANANAVNRYGVTPLSLAANN